MNTLRITTFFGVLFVLLPGQVFANFSDVPKHHAYLDAIEYAQQEGIVRGYPDGTFHPDASVNRVEFIKILIASTFTSDVVASCSAQHSEFKKFPDTNSTAWYAPFLCVAVHESIVGGYPDGTMQPTNEITFVEAAKIIARVLEPGRPFSEEGVWYESYVAYLDEKSAIPSSITGLTHSMTRSEEIGRAHV